ncbi:MAG: hypothetical protein ACRCU3_08410 [Eubacteriaceae bacterium]
MKKMLLFKYDVEGYKPIDKEIEEENIEGSGEKKRLNHKEKILRNLKEGEVYFTSEENIVKYIENGDQLFEVPLRKTEKNKEALNKALENCDEDPFESLRKQGIPTLEIQDKITAWENRYFVKPLTLEIIEEESLEKCFGVRMNNKEIEKIRESEIGTIIVNKINLYKIENSKQKINLKIGKVVSLNGNIGGEVLYFKVEEVFKEVGIGRLINESEFLRLITI